VKVRQYAPDCQRLAPGSQIDQLALVTGMEGSEGSQVIHCLQDAGFALGVSAHQQHRSAWDIHIQAGVIPKISER